MTGYVVTRLYRAPEIMLTWQKYSAKVDVWSSACIFAEMLQGKPLFPGSSHAGQLNQIVKLLGSPPVWILDMITNANVSFETDPVEAIMVRKEAKWRIDERLC